ncbi:OsmC family protein [Kribbia dieselivorans]|uniref:OsmC family protein n=1 Tax=Kribbia dieselivorans TaxID=331526 RepID=UPI000837BC94|nr:OsmC family protein [Kribbia dieselivorans]
MSTTTTATPSKYLTQVDLTSSLVTGTATRVTNRTRQHEFTIDEPANFGGEDLGATPVEHLLAALGACTVITYKTWATKLDIPLDEVEVSLRGEIDLRGFLGLDDEVRPGFGGIDLGITVTGPASQADYVRLAEEVEQHCPVLDNLTNGVPVRRTLTF